MCCGVKFAGRLIFAAATLGAVWRDVMIERVYCLFIRIEGGEDTSVVRFLCDSVQVRKQEEHVGKEIREGN